MKKNTALICIDVQKEYINEGRPLKIANVEKPMKNIITLLDFFRQHDYPIVHVQHVSKDLNDSTFAKGSEFVAFGDDVAPNAHEKVITKNVPGAFYSTELEDYLKSNQIENVVICGFMSFMCCDTTAREAHALGFNVYFLNDATAAIPIDNLSAEDIHEVTCAIQGWMFSKVVSTEDLISIITKND